MANTTTEVVLDYLSYDFLTAPDYPFRHRKSGFLYIAKDLRKRCYLLMFTDTNRHALLDIRLCNSEIEKINKTSKTMTAIIRFLSKEKNPIKIGFMTDDDRKLFVKRAQECIEDVNMENDSLVADNEKSFNAEAEENAPQSTAKVKLSRNDVLHQIHGDAANSICSSIGSVSSISSAGGGTDSTEPTIKSVSFSSSTENLASSTTTSAPTVKNKTVADFAFSTKSFYSNKITLKSIPTNLPSTTTVASPSTSASTTAAAEKPSTTGPKTPLEETIERKHKMLTDIKNLQQQTTKRPRPDSAAHDDDEIKLLQDILSAPNSEPAASAAKIQNKNTSYSIKNFYSPVSTTTTRSPLSINSQYETGNSSKQTANNSRSDIGPLMENNENMSPPSNYSLAKARLMNQGGFLNLGNTCYMNATLQCLLNVKMFARDVVKYNSQFKSYLSSSSMNQQNSDSAALISSSSSNNSGCSKSQLCLYNCLCNLINARKSQNETQQLQALREIKLAIAQEATRFSGYQQHDAHEFLCQVLEQLKDDLEKLTKHNKEQQQKIESEGGIEKISGDNNDEENKKDSSTSTTAIDSIRKTNPVDDNFLFEIQHSIQCKKFVVV